MIKKNSNAPYIFSTFHPEIENEVFDTLIDKLNIFQNIFVHSKHVLICTDKYTDVGGL